MTAPNPAPTGAEPVAPSILPGTTAPATEWRVPADDPRQWARGKTAAEVLNMGDAMYGTLEKFNQTRNLAPAAPAPSTPAAQEWGLSPEDYVSGAQVSQVMNRATQQFQPQVDDAIGLAASGNYGYVRDRYKDEFNKYGPEIQGLLTNVPRRQWTLDTLEQVVKLVRSNHLDEIVDQRAQDLVSRMEPTIRSQGGAGSGPTPAQTADEWANVPPEYRERCQREGINDATINEFCRTMDIPRSEFFAQFGKKVIGEGVAK